MLDQPPHTPDRDPPRDCGCGTCDTLRFLGTKWTPHLLGVLHGDAPLRFNEVQRRLDGVSARTLTDRLRELQDRGLVRRRDHGEEPPRVTYRLTEEGRSLVEALERFDAWARQAD